MSASERAGSWGESTRASTVALRSRSPSARRHRYVWEPGRGEPHRNQPQTDAAAARHRSGRGRSPPQTAYTWTTRKKTIWYYASRGEKVPYPEDQQRQIEDHYLDWCNQAAPAIKLLDVLDQPRRQIDFDYMCQISFDSQYALVQEEGKYYRPICRSEEAFQRHN